MTSTNKLFTTGLCLALSLGILVSGSAFSMTIKEEKTLSLEFKEMVFGSAYIIKDSLIADYVRMVGQKLMAHVPPQPFDYEFHVIKDDTLNAFAGPGGKIFIHSGLFRIMENEEELAGILAHEIAHGVHRHLAERMAQSKKVGVTTLAGLAAGLLLGGIGVPTEAAIVAALSAGQGLALAYSRQAEEQADKSSLSYLKAAGYATDGLQTVLRKIREQEWFGPQDMPTYLSTHPGLVERMAYVASHSDLIPENKEKISSNFEAFTWAHTKLVALYGNVDEALGRFEREVKALPDSVVSHYGYGLALARKQDYKKALKHMRFALDRALFNPHILVDLGRIYFDDAQFDNASAVLKSAAVGAEKNIDRLYYLGRTQLELGEYADAISSFKAILSQNEDIEEAYYHLGEAYGKLNNLQKAHYHLGIFYKRIRNMKNAIFHLERAAKLSTNPEEKEEVEKTLQEIKGQAKKTETDQE